MEIKVNLRKLSAVNKDLIGIITKNRKNFKQTVRLNSFQVEDKELTYTKAVAARDKKVEETFMLQALLSRFRRVVSEYNTKFGVNEVLQVLRETEDQLAILQSSVVSVTDSEEYNGYNKLEEAVAQLAAYESSNETAIRVQRSASKVEVRLITSDLQVADINKLQRKIKKIKDDTLVALNFKDISVEITEIEKELLESLNIL